MTHEQATLINLLFQALDDEVRLQYYVYRKYKGEYPSELSIRALQMAEKEGIGTSKALEKMNLDLAKDITREKAA